MATEQSTSRASKELVKYLLGEGKLVRYQDPKIEKRTDCARHFWFIRPTVPVRTPQGLERRQKRIALGFCDSMTAKEARVAKAEHMSLINGGKFMMQAQVLFSSAVEAFRETAMPILAASTQAKYTGSIERRLLPAFGKLRLQQVDTQAIQRLINGCTSLGWYARTDLKNTCSAIFSHARLVGLWDGSNPAEGVKIGKKTEVRQKIIPTAKQLEDFLAAIEDSAISSADDSRLIVLTAVITGLRISEILGLQAQDIDAAAQTLRVDRGWVRGYVSGTKSASSKRTRQIGPLALLLEQRAKGKKPTDYLFTRENGLPPDSRDLQQHIFRPAAEKAGCYNPGFGMHSFRRLNVSWRQEAGAHPLEAMKAAGHASLTMTNLYTILDSEREREHMQKIWERLGSKKPEERKPDSE